MIRYRLSVAPEIIACMSEGRGRLYKSWVAWPTAFIARFGDRSLPTRITRRHVLPVTRYIRVHGAGSRFGRCRD